MYVDRLRGKHLFQRSTDYTDWRDTWRNLRTLYKTYGMSAETSGLLKINLACRPPEGIPGRTARRTPRKAAKEERKERA
jgi:hypothetical protein